MRRHTTSMIGAVAIAALLAACGGSTAAPPSTNTPTTPAVTPTQPSGHTTSPTPTQSPVPTESPVAIESNPPGDIPDNTAYVPYTSSAGGFKISVPEGWARSTTKTSVTFTDKLNTVVVSWQPATTAPTVATAKSTEVPALKAATRAFQLKSVSTASLPAGPTVLIEYQANSDPNPVTGKQYRLDVLRYELYKSGSEVAITLLSPVGADNVDPWRIITESYAWS
ncbi:MAG: hypothetical protein ACRDH7_04585 [Actinomycetota bacterium]